MNYEKADYGRLREVRFGLTGTRRVGKLAKLMLLGSCHTHLLSCNDEELRLPALWIQTLLAMVPRRCSPDLDGGHQRPRGYYFVPMDGRVGARPCPQLLVCLVLSPGLA